jgi:hypothetical protein
MNYDNEAIVRNAYHTAEGNVLDIPGWIGSFTQDGVFNNVTGEESYRGEHLKDVVIAFGQMLPTFTANFTGSMSWATSSPLSCPFKEPFAARWKRPPA